MSEQNSGNPWNDGNDVTQSGNNAPKKKRAVWIRILRAVGFTLLALLVLILVVITIAVSYLKPERLTPLVEKYANEYLKADVDLGRVEISFWSTFPKFELDVRDLKVNSKAFDRLPAEVKQKLPVSSDSLLSIRHFNGGVNLTKLSVGKIALYDVVFERPVINIVQATPELSNLDIFPESTEEKEESPAVIPDFSIGTFRILDGMPVRYVSIPDSIDVGINLTTTELQGEKSPDYKVDVQGLTSAAISSFHINKLSFGIGGEIKWDHSTPYNVAMRDFNLRLGDVKALLSADVDFDNNLKVNFLDFRLPPTQYSSLVALIPDEMRGELSKVKANLNVELGFKLSEPYSPAIDSLPSFSLDVNIPEGQLSYEQLSLDRLALSASADINGKALDKSTVNISKLLAIGKGVGFELKADLSKLLTDPTADGTFRGGMDFSKLPSTLLAKLPCKISGDLRADSKFFVRRSYLSKNNFHRIRLSGDATLKNLRVSMPELPADLYSKTIELKLGTNSSFTRGQVSVDSLLTASLKIDTISADVTGMELRAGGLKLGVGCQNTASSVDTAIINPIGGRIVAERISFKSQEDSMRVRLRKSTIGATLRRFKGDNKKPQLHLDIATERAFYGDRVNRAMLRKALLFVTVHPSQPRTGVLRNNYLTDSLSKLYPNLSADSISVLAKDIRKARRRQLSIADSTAVAQGEVIDISVDNSMKRLLRQWDAKGVLKAERMRVFTPYFPLPNSLSDLNMRFTSDSVTITDTRLRSGRSEVTLNGAISNITRALTSRNHKQSIKLDFNLSGDTIDVNQLASAAFAGAAFAERDSADVYIAPDTENERELQASVQSGADSVAVLVVPSNVEANLAITAKNIVYSDIIFHDFKGNLNVYNGAINLERMGARTDVGSVNLNALYSAPSKHDASFAFGMRVSDLRIAQFIDLVPSLDSIMPLLSDISGVINADIAATTDIDSLMNIDIPSLKAAVKLSGDSLVLIDPQTFRKIGKWLLFKHKERNVIDHMNVEMIVNNSQLELFPFIFDLDRYKLGVMGNNDMAMNLHYHIAVLKSPLPFKFGINVSGNVDNMKIRLGKAKFNEKNMPRTVAIADTTRINLVREIGNIFRRGVRNSKMKGLDFSKISSAQAADAGIAADTISHADSLYFIKEGLIPAPDTVPAPVAPLKNKKSKK